jgi:Tfp pilus assembly protein PilO
MNRNITAIILIVLAIGIYFTFTRAKVAELQSIRALNAEYQRAIDDSEKLIQVRDAVLASYNNINENDKERLDKIVPNNVDNVRLIIDVKDDIAARHGLSLRNIETSSPDLEDQGNRITPQYDADGNPLPGAAPSNSMNRYGVVNLSFEVTAPYPTFVAFMKDLEASLRIMDVSNLMIATTPEGAQVFTVEVKTYWLRE